MVFYSLYDYYLGRMNLGRSPKFDQWMANRLARVFCSGKWVERATILIANRATYDWGKKAPDGNLLVPESLALTALIAFENYIQWAKTDPRWEQHYQKAAYRPAEEYLVALPAKIIATYPKLTERRIKARGNVADAAPIRAWKPEGPGLSDSRNWLFGEAMISKGDSLFVPMISQGVIELDVRTMAVKRVLALPLPGESFIWGIACNRESMMMNIRDRLFISRLDGDGKSWVEIHTPGVTNVDPLTWCVRGFEDEFFVGSCMTNHSVKTPRMLAGMARDGKVDLACLQRQEARAQSTR